MKVYISGKMKGLSKELSQNLFKEAEQYIISCGDSVINPWDIIHQSDKWEEIILEDLNILKGCDAIYMLNNWKDSFGACTEYYFAKGMGLKVLGNI